MNREILFRAKRDDNEEWINGLPSYGINGNITELYVHIDFARCYPYEIDPRTVCLMAGTVSGQEIWENDICQWTNTIYGKCTGVVRYGEWTQDGSDGEYDGTKCLGWYLEIKRVQMQEGNGLVFTDEEAEEEYPDYKRTISLIDDDTGDIQDFAVVGNIFDNPELLEVDRNEEV